MSTQNVNVARLQFWMRLFLGLFIKCRRTKIASKSNLDKAYVVLNIEMPKWLSRPLISHFCKSCFFTTPQKSFQNGRCEYFLGARPTMKCNWLNINAEKKVNAQFLKIHLLFLANDDDFLHTAKKWSWTLNFDKWLWKWLEMQYNYLDYYRLLEGN